MTNELLISHFRDNWTISSNNLNATAWLISPEKQQIPRLASAQNSTGHGKQ